MLLTSLLIAILASSPSELEAWEQSKFYTRPQQITTPKVDLSTHPIGRRYRTQLKRTVAAGVNFAGHYSLVRWGCGTSCTQLAIVDLLTGEIWHDPKLIATRGVEFRADTRLLAFNPRGEDGAGFPKIPVEYFEWTGRTLRRVRPPRTAP